MLSIAWKLLKCFVVIAGICAIVLLALCFTDVPWRLYHWLAKDSHLLGEVPDYIVVLGGGGVPSESGLTRAFATAQAARRFDDAWVVVALPYGDSFKNSAAKKMSDEVILRGVEPDRILLERHGRNTREQAINIARMIDADPAEAPVLLVTSPEHIKRALMAFRKAGFANITGGPAYSEAIEMNLRYNSGELGGNEIPISDIGGTIVVRYEFWNNIGYLGCSARELVALGYYWLKGWI